LIIFRQNCIFGSPIYLQFWIWSPYNLIHKFSLPLLSIPGQLVLKARFGRWPLISDVNCHMSTSEWFLVKASFFFRKNYTFDLPILLQFRFWSPYSLIRTFGPQLYKSLYKFSQILLRKKLYFKFQTKIQLS